jgi:endonuclease/exonuclease/phosphatase (EEP) superfamily protein YafD
MGWRQLRLLPAAAILMQLSACAHRPVIADISPALQFSTEVSVCRDMLAADSTTGAELDASNISLFNWNVHKTRERRWREDFDAFANNADLVLFQEASLREETIAEIDSSRHWSFAPGYRKWGEVTGVMTLSGVKPLTQCSFVHSEPWLRTPKATSVTQYGLTDTDQTLVVINVHAVNFSWGTGAYEKQFEQIRQVLENHEGPIILSGDLNTWRAKRVEIIEELATSLDLTAVAFENDNRVQVFGNTLDHIYIRGLHALDANTEIVDTSDHNPMTAVFGM